MTQPVRHRLDRLTRHIAALSLLSGFTLTTACATDQTADDTTQVASALEQPNGGLDTSDEQPMFGAPEEFTAANLGTDTAYDDSAIENSDAVTADLSAPDAAVYDTVIVWGNLPLDQNQVAHDWSGTLSINRGAILIRRLIRFEDATDGVDRPRTDPASISFTSVTKLAGDGVRLTIVDPDPSSADPLMLTYTPNTGDVFSVAMSALLSGPQSEEVDGGANRVVALAMQEPADPCNHGFLAGRWRRIDDTHGRLIGRVVGAEGDPLGHVRGVFGQRRNGDNVFFGKYIDTEGHFKGLFGGGYGDGAFRGRWLVRDDLDHGVLAGRYRETAPGPDAGGFFLGRWAETSCNLPLAH